MPPSGKRRLLTIYYMRVIAAFVIMWVPFVVMVFFVANGRPWLAWFGGAWSHLQGPVSGVFVLMKPDITQAYKKLMCRFSVERMSSRMSSARRTTSSKERTESKCHSTIDSMNLEDDGSSSIVIVFEKDGKNVEESGVEEAPIVVSAAGPERKEESDEDIAEDYADGFLPIQESHAYTFSDEEPRQETHSFSSSNAV
jgi:hypothetical protein